MHEQSLISQANDLMALGQSEQAQNILDALLRQHPGNKSVYGDVASIFFMGHMYKKVKEVFEAYQQQTGRDLHEDGGADFSIEEVEETMASTSQSGRQFKAVPLFPGLSKAVKLNYWRTHGITEIDISPERLTIMKNGHTYSYGWSDITEAKLTVKSAKPQRGVLINDVTLRANDASFHFWVVPAMEGTAPRFEREGALLSALRQHLHFTEVHKKPRWLLGLLLGLAVVVLLWLVAQKMKH